MLYSDNILVGVLDAFFETGTEGVIWAFVDNSQTGYDALNVLRDGDYLFIEDGNGFIEWEGSIKLEYTNRRIPRSTNSDYFQQEVNGHWVHGLQEGVKPELWARWFFESRPAVLRKV